MRSQFLLGLSLAVVLAFGTASGQERLVLVPKVAPADQSFKVALPQEFLEAAARGDDTPIKYEWQVTDAATKAPFAVEVGIANLTEGKVSTKLPVLEITTPKKVRYRFEVRRSDADEDTAASLVEVDATGEFAQLAVPAEVEPAESATTPAATRTAAATTTAAGDQKWPTPFDVEPGSSQDAIQERLGDARAWWNANVIQELKPAPLVDEVFIRLKLTEDDKGNSASLKDQMQSPLIAAARFYRAAYAAAEAPPDKAAEVWKTERERLIKEIDADDQETNLVVQLVRNFLEALEAEIKRKTADKPQNFGPALRESAMVIGKLLLKKVEADIGGLGTGPSGSGGSSGGDGATYSSGDGYYGTSHAAVHHARAMSRIHMRNSRRLARIQSFQ